MSDTESVFKIIEHLETILSQAALEEDVQSEEGSNYFIVDVETVDGPIPIFFNKSLLPLLDKLISPSYSCDTCQLRRGKKPKLQNKKCFPCQSCGLQFRRKESVIFGNFLPFFGKLAFFNFLVSPIKKWSRTKLLQIKIVTYFF